MGRVQPALSEIEPGRIADAALRAVDGIAAGQVEVVRRFEHDGVKIQADADLLVFAIENLVRNACEAMGRGGTLTVATEVDRQVGARLRISVEDTGPGMDVRNLERAMGGLYTTKEGGTGLGLAFVRRVVTAHGGRFHVVSQAGRGTKAVIDLPATSGA